jgi:folate-dependent phosphoribosylglycinamide formyltransferase PurN
MKHKIILLSGEKQFIKYIYNGLKNTFEIEAVIFEEAESLDIIYKRRIKRVGVVEVFGQKLFDKFIINRLLVSSVPRIKEIIQYFKLDSSKIPEEKKILVNSVNDVDTIKIIQGISPDIVIVNATRILKSNLIRSITGHFINIHSGILPKYRGYSGGYWALVNNDKKNCGSTIHFIDEKIDMGSIICQETINIKSNDNYLTYAFLHVAKEIELLKKAIFLIVNNEFKLTKNKNFYKLRYGPTIWGYLFYRIVKNIK